MIEQENLSRRALLKGLFAAPLMIPFQADAQTFYRAIAADWEEQDATRGGLVICSESFSFSQPSHIVEAFGDLYASFRTVDSVVRDIGQGRLLPVGNLKGNKWVPVGNQVVSGHYQEVTTNSPDPEQQYILNMVKINNPFSGFRGLTNSAFYGGPLAALQYNLAGAMFYQQALTITATITLAIFHLARISELLAELKYLRQIGSSRLPWKKKEVAPLIKSASLDEAVEWKVEPGWFRPYNPSIWHDMTSELENTPSYDQKCLELGLPGGKKHRKITEDKSYNLPIRIGWYPSYQEQTWMGDSPKPWYFDDYGRPQVGRRKGKRLFNLLSYRNSRNRGYGRFFTVTT